MRDSEGKEQQDQVVGKVCREELTLQVTSDLDRVSFLPNLRGWLSAHLHLLSLSLSLPSSLTLSLYWS